MRKYTNLLLILPIFFSSCNEKKKPESYLDPNLEIDKRVEILLSQISIEEKVGQMSQYVSINFIEERTKEKFNLTEEDFKKSDAFAFYKGYSRQMLEQMVKDGLIGSFLHITNIAEANRMQELASGSEHKIPILMGIDASHGHTFFSPAATIYPTLIGLGSTWNPELAKQIGQATAQEMRATGYHWTFSANFSVSLDARWGRVGETFGEDPYHVGKMGSALIKGYQGKDFSEPENVIACANHYIAGSEPPNGLNFAPMDLSERRLREVFLPPYKAAVDAGVHSIMLYHNEVNGMPCHANRYLITDILKEELGFEGLVLSDWNDVERLHSIYKIADSEKNADKLAIDAGLDVNMHGPGFYKNVVELVKEGKIPESRIDESVRKILKTKFQLGLFENRYVDEEAAKKVVLKQEHKDLALKAARQSIVLLKNDASILPLDKKPKKIFLSGPNANNHALLGDWTKPQPAENITTVYEGIQHVIPESASLDFFECGEIWEMGEKEIQTAVQRAKNADVAILVVGENSLRHNGKKKTCGENSARDNIELPGLQLDLIKRVHETGTPTIVVLINGRPNASEWLAENVNAMIEAWEPGMFGGQAVAEVIFGDANPSGKLAITIPRNTGQIPCYYYHRPAFYYRGYANNETGPNYTFGYGLSYTSFEYSKLTCPEKIKSGEDIPIKLTVKNSGDMAGDEVVMVFLRDVYSSVTTPVKKLVAFKRISTETGESKNVELTIKAEDLALYDVNMKKVIEPGEFEVIVGLDKLKTSFEVIE